MSAEPIYAALKLVLAYAVLGCVWMLLACAALKLVLVYAVLGCVWMLLAYAAFISVVMVTGRGGSCGGPTMSYVFVGTRSLLVRCFHHSNMMTDMSIATIMITAMSAPTTPPTTAPILSLLGVVRVVSDEVVAVEVRVEEEVSEVVDTGNQWCVR